MGLVAGGESGDRAQAGQDQFGGKLGQRDCEEWPVGDVGIGDAQIAFRDGELVVREDVQIDGPRGILVAGAAAAKVRLDLAQDIELERTRSQ